ncbi:hypothetical protein D3C78_1604230 [compost metagenome]
MGFHAADNHLLALQQGCRQALSGDAGEMQFLHHQGLRRRLLEGSDGRPEALGVLLGNHRRQPQLGSSGHQPARARQGTGRVADGTNEFFLHVDDQQAGLVRLDQHSLHLRRG